MNIAATPIVERIAKVLAALQLSRNADGFEASASQSVDLEWEDRIGDALAILRTMREPDAEMARVGDPKTWEAMIGAALALHGGKEEGNPLAPPINIGAGS